MSTRIERAQAAEMHPKGWRTPSRAKGDEARGNDNAARPEEGGAARGYGLICGVSFSRLLSNCAPAPTASTWHGFPLYGVHRQGSHQTWKAEILR